MKLNLTRRPEKIDIASQRTVLYCRTEFFPNATVVVMSLQKTKNLLFPLLFLGLAVGCNYRPQWGAPGTKEVQRNRAVIHDPFPSNVLGPPIVGARPRGFDQPQAETVSLQSSPYARKGSKFTPANGF